MRRVAITILCPVSPWPTQTGPDLRIAMLATALAGMAKVQVIGLIKRDNTPAPSGIDEQIMAPIGQIVNWGRWSMHRPIIVPPMPEETAFVRQAIAQHQPNLVVLTPTDMARFGAALRSPTCCIVQDMHNIESDVIRQKTKTLWWPGDLWRQAYRSMRARTQDKFAADRADAVWLCSQQDQQLLASLSKTPGTIIGNPVPNYDTITLPITPERYARGQLLFVGDLRYQPNQAAINKLLRKVLPKLAADFTLTIAGRCSHGYKPINNAARPARYVLNAPDLTPELAAAGYSPMPIVAGGGTRLKALEAMAAGLVIVATSKAVEGLGLIDGTHYIRAESAPATAAALAELRANPHRPMAIAVAARNLVKQRFSPEIQAAEIQHAARMTMANNRRPTHNTIA